jgi:predicted RNA-binding protein YlxR (DUF448 family)
MTTSPSGTKKTAKPRQKHVPQRMCAVCRETNAKRTLTRIVRTSESTFEVDITGRANGRGAYLCDKASCWEKAAAKPDLARALRVTPDNESIEHLKEFAAGQVLERDAPTSTVGSKEKHV